MQNIGSIAGWSCVSSLCITTTRDSNDFRGKYTNHCTSDRETTCPHCLRKLKWKQNLPRHLQTCPVYKSLSTTSAKADGSSGDGRTTSMIDSMHFSPSVGQTMTPGDELRTIPHESTPYHNESLPHVLNQWDMDKVEVRQSLLLPSAKNTKAWHTINAQLKIHLTQHFPTSYLKKHLHRRDSGQTRELHSLVFRPETTTTSTKTQECK